MQDFHFSCSIFTNTADVFPTQCSWPPVAPSVWGTRINVLRWKTDVLADFCVPEGKKIICEEQGRPELITAAGSDLI